VQHSLLCGHTTRPHPCVCCFITLPKEC
jgi:hypothetical protein